MVCDAAAKPPRHHQHHCPREQGTAATSAQVPLLPSPRSCGGQAEGSAAHTVGQDGQGGCSQAALELTTVADQAQADEWDRRMQLDGESRMLWRLVAQLGPIALGLDVNTNSLTSFSNHIFKAMC